MKTLKINPLIEKTDRVCGWLKLWDNTLDKERKYTLGLQALSRVLGHHCPGWIQGGGGGPFVSKL